MVLLFVCVCVCVSVSLLVGAGGIKLSAVLLTADTKWVSGGKAVKLKLSLLAPVLIK